MSMACRSTRSTLAVQTPPVARRRPLPARGQRHGTWPVTPPISVRFSEPMDPGARPRAFTVSGRRQAMAGNGPLGRARHGPHLQAHRDAAVRHEGRDATSRRRARSAPASRSRRPPRARSGRSPSAARRPPRRHGGSRSGSTGGGRRSVAGAGERSRPTTSGLMNCTRTGGWVTSTGTCSSPGGRNVAPLRLDQRDQLEGQPAVRQAARGRQRLQPLHRWQPGRPPAPRRLHELSLGREPRLPVGQRRGAVLGSHLFFQSEKSYNGGHYVNLMNAEVQPRRDRRLGLRRAGPPRDRLLPPLTGPSAG